MPSLANQKACALVASRYFSGEQSGPRPRTREGTYVATVMKDVAETLAVVMDHAEEFARWQAERRRAAN